MRRSRRAQLAAPLLAVVLAGCTGSGGDATHGSVREKVREQLVERDGFDGDADAVAGCVADRMFESGDWTPEERNAAARSGDSDAPNPALVAKVEDLVEGCIADPGEPSGEPSGSG